MWIINKLFVPDKGQSFEDCLGIAVLLILFGILNIVGFLNFPSLKYIKKNGFLNLNFKEIYRTTDLKGKYFFYQGVFLVFMGIIRGLGYTIYVVFFMN